MPDTLYNLCIEKYSNSLCEGQLHLKRNDLDNKLGVAVYENLAQPKRNTPPEVFENFVRIYNFDRLKWNVRNNEEESYRTAPSTQILKELQLCTQDCIDGEKIETLLQKMVNETSRQTMTKLEIRCRVVDLALFKRGWMKSIAQFLPNLQFLSLYKVQLGKTEFAGLCKSLPTLRGFELRECRDWNIDGISLLSHLEHLCLRRKQFTLSEYYEEISQLPKLKSLDTNVGLFYQSDLSVRKEAFPALEQLDIYCSRVDISCFKNFVETHPKLKHVNLIYTDLSEHADFKNSNTKFLTTGSLKSCLASLEFNGKPERFPKIYEIIRQMQIYLDNYEQQSEDILRKCPEVMIRTCKKVNLQFQLLISTVRCLWLLLKDGRSEIFTFEEKQRFLKFLLHESNKKDPKNGKLCFKMVEEAFKVFSIPELIKNSRENVDSILKLAEQFWAQSIRGNRFPLNCLMAVSTCLEVVTPDKRGKLKYEFTTSIIRYAKQAVFDNDEVHLELLQAVRVLLVFEITEDNWNDKKLLKESLFGLLIDMDKYNNEVVQVQILEVLEICVQKVERKHRLCLFRKSVFFKLAKFLQRNEQVQKAAVCLYVTLMKMDDFLITGSEELKITILNCIQGYYRPDDPDDLAIFKWVKSVFSIPGVVVWANWVLEKFEEIEEPKAKIRRKE
ncbi:hypothetical protein CRE_20484 [Caenorhabditis remanei]|uniref:Uncharacterized protein n=1 Tax=Caenorhabditis remanei TaxID=31234 RepID=E3N2T9_CAERE|nr:hypothetical protein CRE_20484 [Caenorhabditis remanei]